VWIAGAHRARLGFEDQEFPGLMANVAIDAAYRFGR
jgi:hypothetical protein